jgi:hypothetical protein
MGWGEAFHNGRISIDDGLTLVPWACSLRTNLVTIASWESVLPGK